MWRERRNPGRHLETLRDMLFRDGTEAQAQDFIAEHLTPVVAFDFLMYSVENRELRPMVERQDRRPPLPISGGIVNTRTGSPASHFREFGVSYTASRDLQMQIRPLALRFMLNSTLSETRLEIRSSTHSKPKVLIAYRHCDGHADSRSAGANVTAPRVLRRSSRFSIRSGRITRTQSQASLLTTMPAASSVASSFRIRAVHGFPQANSLWMPGTTSVIVPPIFSAGRGAILPPQMARNPI